MLYMNSYSVRGFSLLEMLVTITIIGIFAVLTLPTYQDSLRTGRRGEAKAELMRLAQAEAKWRLTHKGYASFEELGGAAESRDYIFAVADNTANTFAITATPTGIRGQNLDICGRLTINQEAVMTSNRSACSKP